MISTDDLLWYVDEALDGMVAVVTSLGDGLVNRRPDLPGANSPFAIVTHCLGVIEFWGGHVIAGRTIERDRDAEFVATGRVADLLARLGAVRAQLGVDVAGIEPAAPIRGSVLDPEDAELPLGRSQGGAFVHVLEELAQHRGQLELTRDVLLQDSGDESSTDL